MTEERDFERAWLSKFSACLDEVAGEQLKNEVMEGSEGLTSRSSRQEVIHWSRRAMERLDAQVKEEKRKAILTGCACQYPKSDLQAMRKAYEATGDAALAHRMLREQFEAFLKDTLALDAELVEEIVRRGWGAAGVMKG
ncbi:MAG: hypothetical protein KAI38_07430, partial [Candidatus Latescibacteria bacterium]|nr:hypothetical protein [Candidatus Latescibacterota bacterium]